MVYNHQVVEAEQLEAEQPETEVDNALPCILPEISQTSVTIKPQGTTLSTYR